MLETKLYYIIEIIDEDNYRPFDYDKDICDTTERIDIHNFNYLNGFPGYYEYEKAVVAATRILGLSQDMKLRIKRVDSLVKTQKIEVEKTEQIVCNMSIEK